MRRRQVIEIGFGTAFKFGVGMSMGFMTVIGLTLAVVVLIMGALLL